MLYLEGTEVEFLIQQKLLITEDIQHANDPVNIACFIVIWLFHKVSVGFVCLMRPTFEQNMGIFLVE